MGILEIFDSERKKAERVATETARATNEKRAQEVREFLKRQEERKIEREREAAQARKNLSRSGIDREVQKLRKREFQVQVSEDGTHIKVFRQEIKPCTYGPSPEERERGIYTVYSESKTSVNITRRGVNIIGLPDSIIVYPLEESIKGASKKGLSVHAEYITTYHGSSKINLPFLGSSVLEEEPPHYSPSDKQGIQEAVAKLLAQES